eukprot:m.21279 g.21279  ORF g.21279 m.21279 type:complete len:268 (-) comp3610_c0_seq1:154-957(-)
MDLVHSVLTAVHATLAPPPLSPLFHEGGRFAGWNEDLVLTALGILFLFIVDTTFVKRFIAPKGRYFALHVVANSISLIAAAPDVWRALTQDPRYAFSGPSHTMVANSIVASIHLYHCIAFDLRREDIMHHLVFVSILCGLAIPFKQVGGVANNFGCFFLSGLPGGIDYVLLTLVAQGLMDKGTEKKWCARINVWLRGPSMCVYAFLGWLSFLHDHEREFHNVFLFIVVALHFLNGQYYTDQAVASYAVFKERQNGAKGADAASKKSD